MKTPRYDPRVIRKVLDEAARTNPHHAATLHGVDHRTAYRWVKMRAERGPSWPDEALTAVWDATIEERARKAARLRDYRKRVYLNRGPLSVDATGTARRLQALQALGWLSYELAERLDCSPERVQHMTKPLYSRVLGETAERVRALYAELSMTVPTETTAPLRRGQVFVRDRQRRAAKAKGWLLPLAWDDERMDDPAYQPRPRRTTTLPGVRTPARRADVDAAECPRCGVRRQVRTTQRAALCTDCKAAERTTTTTEQRAS